MPWMRRLQLPDRPKLGGDEFIALRDECARAGLHLRYDTDARCYAAGLKHEDRQYDRAYPTLARVRTMLEDWVDR